MKKVKQLGKRLLGIALALVMALSVPALLPTTAHAAMDSSVYNKVSSKNISNPALFLSDVLETGLKYPLMPPSNGAGTVYNVNCLWTELTYSLFNVPASFETYPFALDGSVATQASSVKTVNTEMAADINKRLTGDRYTHSHFGDPKKALLNEIRDTGFFPAGKTPESGGPAFYTYMIYKDFDSAPIFQDHLLLLTTIYYDFELVPLADAGAGTAIGNKLASAINTATSKGKTYSMVTENRASSGTATGTQAVSTSASASVSRSSSQTSSYTVNQSIGSSTTVSVNAPLDLGGVSTTLSMEFGTSKMFSTTSEMGLAEASEVAQSSTITAECPPHTVALMSSETFEGKQTVSYNYPVGVRFKVQQACIKVQTGFPAVPARAISNTQYNFSESSNSAYAGNAAESFIDRYNNRNRSGYETAHKGLGAAVDWNSTISNRNPLRLFAEHFNKNRLYCEAGGSLSVNVQGTSSSVNKYAIYPLSQVRATGDFATDYTMPAGSTLYTDTIPLEGVNAQNVPYYGFDKTFGKWELLDANGNNISAAGNTVAKLKTNSVSGRSYLETSGKAGTVYLKYMIEEDRYNYYDKGAGLNTFATNASLSKTAMVRINVSGMPRALSVNNGTGSGSYTAGTSVQISANTAPAGMRFKNWTASPAVSFSNASSTSTSFTMLDQAVTVTANYEPIPDEEKVGADKNALTEDAIKGGNTSSSGVTGNLNLPQAGDNGSTINWTSSNPGVIGADGTVIRPDAGQPDAEVTLTATITSGGVAQTVSFTITVKAQPGSGALVDDVTPLPEATVTGVKLAQSSIRMTKGKKATIGVVATLSDGTTTSRGLTWKSSNPKVATVDKNGKITAKSIANTDTVTITATAENGKSAKIKVTVLGKNAAAVPATKATISGAKKTLDIGKTAQLKAKVSSSNATNAAISWKSSKPGVLKVDATGKLTALKEGTAKITLKAGSASTSVTITVSAPVKKISVDKKSVSLAKKGATATIKPTVTYSTTGYTAKLTWKSSNTKVATVNSKGKITATGKGTAVITVSAANGKSAKVKVTVK